MASSSSSSSSILNQVLNTELQAIFSSYPPPFIYINDASSDSAASERLTTSTVIHSLCQNSVAEHDINGARNGTKIKWSLVNGVACFTIRLLYDSILNGFRTGGSSVTSEDSEETPPAADFDAFLDRMRVIGASDSKGKGKAKQQAPGKVDRQESRIVIIVERAERLKDNVPELLVPLTRLAELVCANFCKMFRLLKFSLFFDFAV